MARTRGLGRFVTEQPPYSMLVRGIERDLLPVAEQYGMGVLPWSPLAGGWLSGRFRARPGRPGDPPRPGGCRRATTCRTGENQLKLERADALAEVAESAGMTLVDMAVAFVINHPAVTSAIIGPRTMEQLESQLGAADVDLTADVLDAIDEIVPPGRTRRRTTAATTRRRSPTPGAAAADRDRRRPQAK